MEGKRLLSTCCDAKAATSPFASCGGAAIAQFWKRISKVVICYGFFERGDGGGAGGGPRHLQLLHGARCGMRWNGGRPLTACAQCFCAVISNSQLFSTHVTGFL